MGYRKASGAMGTMDYVVHERFASDESNERRELSASKVRQSYTIYKNA